MTGKRGVEGGCFETNLFFLKSPWFFVLFLVSQGKKRKVKMRCWRPVLMIVKKPCFDYKTMVEKIRFHRSNTWTWCIPQEVAQALTSALRLGVVVR